MTLTSLLEHSHRWACLCQRMAEGWSPSALWLVAPDEFQSDLGHCYARMVLCEQGNGCGVCRSCRAWDGQSHPDWLTPGTVEKAPLVDQCREAALSLDLSPVVAPIRLLTLWQADRLLGGAANCLLKITEEPPPHGRLCFLSATAGLLPTLRSRVWMLSFEYDERVSPIQPPQSDGQWVEWLKAAESRTAADWRALTLGYGAWLAEQGRWQLASTLSQLAVQAENAHLSGPQWADLVLLLLREEYPCEYLFDDLRQASIFGPCRRRRPH